MWRGVARACAWKFLGFFAPREQEARRSRVLAVSLKTIDLLALNGLAQPINR